MSVIGDPAEFKGEELKCSYAAFREQNKTDNDSKCQLVYNSLKKELSPIAWERV